MTKIQGIIQHKGTVSVAGVSLQFFTLAIAGGLILDGMPFYNAVFVERLTRDQLESSSPVLEPTTLALKLAVIEKGTLVSVSVAYDGSIERSAAPDLSKKIYVNDVDCVATSLHWPPA